MPKWKQVLDAIVAGQSPAAHATILRIPSIDGWEPGHVWCTMTVDQELIQPQGAVFGGYLSAVADEMLGMTALSILADDEVVSTSDLHVHFFRPVRRGDLKIEGRVVHKGRSSVHVEVTFADEQGRLLAKAVATQVIRRSAVGGAPRP